MAHRMLSNALFLFFQRLQILIPILIIIPSSLSSAQRLPINANEGKHDIYIVEVERHERHKLFDDDELEGFHRSFLPNSTLDSGEPRLVYSYRHVLSGFAARLTPDELDAVKSKSGFLHAEPDRADKPATTYTPGYLGVSNSSGWAGTMMGNGIIIGIVDTGIKSTHPSFDDTGMPSPPPRTKWKGNCSYRGIRCNNKIIGAMAFNGGLHPSPEDEEGHGTHVAGIAGGNFVTGANVLGMARGEASGMAPMAHLSIYRVCFPIILCSLSNQYAGIDQAIKDGVDIISVSIGGGRNDKLYEDTVSRGGMAALQHGILTVASAGNQGPSLGTLSHSAPWLLTVGASTTDRRIDSIVELGDGRKFAGESAYQPRSFNSSKPLLLDYPGQFGDYNASCCLPASISTLNLRGKIVLCNTGLISNVEKGEAAKAAGAEAIIILSRRYQGYATRAYAHVLPASYVNYRDGDDIVNYYLNARPYANATIHFNGTRFGFMPSPAVTYSSSRGPSGMNGGIIKPDVIAPGVNILSAWSKAVGPNPSPLATHTFNFDTGTSMAAPHVSGIAALVRSKHRGWSPSEIISAIVTTANDSWTATGDLIVDDNSNRAANPYTMGAGLVSPVKALDPGLVYGLTLNDYVRYLCGLGYADWELKRTVGRNLTCIGGKNLTASELNYPSISINLAPGITMQKVNRTVTNVGGNMREDYIANITQETGVKIYLSTYNLQFTRDREQKSYEITIDATTYPKPRSGIIRGGKIVWNSGKHMVTSPVAIRFT